MVSTDSLIYDIFVRTTTRGVEIYTLDYDENLKIFSPSGEETSSRDWTSRVRTVAIGDIDADGDDDIIAGTKDCIIVMSNEGDVIYRIAEPSPAITCDAADIDGDLADEFSAAFRDGSVTLWNDDMTLFTRSFPSSVQVVRLENMTEDPELEVVVIERDGTVSILSAAGYLLKKIKLATEVRVGTVLDLDNEKLLATGDKSDILKIWDMSGNLVTTLELTARPYAIDADRRPRSDVLYMAVGTRYPSLEIYRITGEEKPSVTKKIVREISSTKQMVYRRAIRCGNCGAPVSPETPTCASCGAQLEELEEDLDEFISEIVLSVSTLGSKIRLRELDRMIRRSLPRPAVYNLRNHIQEMVKRGLLSGHFIEDGRVFVETDREVKMPAPTLSKRDARKLLSAATTGKRIELADFLDMRDALTDPDVDHELDPVTLRRALMILQSEGRVAGKFVDTTSFELESEEEMERVIEELVDFLTRIGR
ncbi:hypothetical protein EU520_00385 [Candidatus Thorarchaeota archaeon]|nr:MAG: hypothetical protein EU520_00385 [Candidatus Thorarchaeota archaeon]